MSGNNLIVSGKWVELSLMDAIPLLRANYKSLTHLDLYQQRIDAKGARAIGKALKVNRTLKGLYLRYNNIGNEGARSLAKALEENCTLTHVYLTCNNIGAEGARALAETLKANGTLSALGLGDNNIGVEGAHALADALRVNGTLAELLLNNCKIGAGGERAFMSALAVNRSLVKLDWDHNQGGGELKKLMRKRKESKDRGEPFRFDLNDVGGDNTGVKDAICEAAALELVHKALLQVNDGGSKEAIRMISDGARRADGTLLVNPAADLNSDEARNLIQFRDDVMEADFHGHGEPREQIPCENTGEDGEKGGELESALDDLRIETVRSDDQDDLDETPGVSRSAVSVVHEVAIDVDLDAVVKEGELQTNSISKIKRQKLGYFVLRRDGSLIYYKTKEERDKDSPGLQGKPKPKKVIRNAVNANEDQFFMEYKDGSKEKFKCPLAGDGAMAWAEAWESSAKAHFLGES